MSAWFRWSAVYAVAFGLIEREYLGEYRAILCCLLVDPPVFVLWQTNGCKMTRSIVSTSVLVLLPWNALIPDFSALIHSSLRDSSVSVFVSHSGGPHRAPRLLKKRWGRLACEEFLYSQGRSAQGFNTFPPSPPSPRGTRRSRGAHSAIASIASIAHCINLRRRSPRKPGIVVATRDCEPRGPPHVTPLGGVTFVREDRLKVSNHCAKYLRASSKATWAFELSRQSASSRIAL